MLRTCFLLPSATGLASASLLFYAVLPAGGPRHQDPGLLRIDGWGRFHAPPPARSALWATIIVIVWRFSGCYMLLMMIGLQAIPGDL